MDPALVVVVNAAFFFAMGAVGLLRPQRVPAVFGMHEITADFRNEVRAIYGGFGIFIGGILLYAQFISNAPAGMILTVGLSLFAMAFGRLVSVLIEKNMGFWPRVFMLIEVLLGSSLIWVIQVAGG